MEQYFLLMNIVFVKYICLLLKGDISFRPNKIIAGIVNWRDNIFRHPWKSILKVQEFPHRA